MALEGIHSGLTYLQHTNTNNTNPTRPSSSTHGRQSSSTRPSSTTCTAVHYLLFIKRDVVIGIDPAAPRPGKDKEAMAVEDAAVAVYVTSFILITLQKEHKYVFAHLTMPYAL